MWRDRLWQFLQAEIFTLDPSTLPGAGPLFNPWLQNDPDVDLPEAPAIRRANLRRYLESLPDRPAVLVVGEAPGPWDCRFSGVPITGERQLVERSLDFGGRVLFTGERSSRTTPAVATHIKPPFKSSSSAIFWKLLGPHHPGFVIWNSVPFHPYHAGRPLSVRSPTAREVTLFAERLRRYVAIVEPRQVVAMGRKAEGSLQAMGLGCTYVRHPSRGGAPEFRRGMEQVFAGL
jgi:uracil-DNA glycosylase